MSFVVKCKLFGYHPMHESAMKVGMAEIGFSFENPKVKMDGFELDIEFKNPPAPFIALQNVGYDKTGKDEHRYDITDLGIRGVTFLIQGYGGQEHLFVPMHNINAIYTPFEQLIEGTDELRTMQRQRQQEVEQDANDQYVGMEAQQY